MADVDVTHKICIIDSIKERIHGNYSFYFTYTTTPKIAETALLDRIKHIAKVNGVAMTQKTAYAVASKYFDTYRIEEWSDYYKIEDYDEIMKVVSNNKDVFTFSKMNR